MKIILLGNYIPDAQHSMLGILALFEKHLKKQQLDITVIQPPIIFGQLTNHPRLKKWLGYIDKYILFPIQLFSLNKKYAQSNCLVHILDHANALYIHCIPNLKYIITCHDLLAIRSSLGEIPNQTISITGKILQWCIYQSLKKASIISCISHQTQKHCIRLLNKHSSQLPVIHLAIAEEYLATHSTHSLTNQPYWLHVGGDAWYKNRLGILALYKALEQTTGKEKLPHLIFIGPCQKEVINLIQKNNWEKLITIIPHTTPLALINWYTNADFLIFPSLYEGWGLPIAEAQSCGCRVITTHDAPMTEVGGKAAIYLESPHAYLDKSSWAQACIPTLLAAIYEKNPHKAIRIALGQEQAKKWSPSLMIHSYQKLYACQTSQKPH